MDIFSLLHDTYASLAIVFGLFGENHFLLLAWGLGFFKVHCSALVIVAFEFSDSINLSAYISVFYPFLDEIGSPGIS